MTFSAGTVYSDGGCLLLTLLDVTPRSIGYEARNTDTGGFCHLRASHAEMTDLLISGGWYAVPQVEA